VVKSAVPEVVQAKPHSPNRQARAVPAGIPDDEQTLPQTLQLLTSLCRFTHVVGFVVGQARVAAPCRGAQVPFCTPVSALEHAMQPAPAAASGQLVLQQTLSTQKVLAHSAAPPHDTPTPFFATQTVPMQ
jgi:hypothetical protein